MAHNAGIFDLLVHINDIQALNSAINTPAGQAQPLTSTGLSGQFFQLPGTVVQPSPQQAVQAPISIDPNQLLLPTGGGDGGNGSAAFSIDRTLANNFGLTAAGVDTAQQAIGGFGIPGLGVPGVGLGRTFSNLGALNAAERALGQPETGLLGELLDVFPSALTGRTSLRERAVSRGDEAARFLADPTASIRSGATQGRIDAAQKRSAQEASRARELTRVTERREQNRLRDVANAKAEEELRAASAIRAQQERAQDRAEQEAQAARASIETERFARASRQAERDRDSGGDRDNGSSEGGRGGFGSEGRGGSEGTRGGRGV